MHAEQWERLCSIVAGGYDGGAVSGFIIDSPWLPNWAGYSILDYYASESVWFHAHENALARFPEAMFLPGFWAEYGMCTEPSAFGAKCIWAENEFPFAARVLHSLETTGTLVQPNPKTDGLAPFVIKRLQLCQARIADLGHAIRFAVARGPLNIAGFLMGNTELMLGMKLEPDAVHGLLEVITGYLREWLQWQKEMFPSIEGIFLLDDLVGFCGEPDFLEFAKPYLRRLYGAFDAKIRFFHNDAHGLVCAPHLAEMGVNLFNFSHEHSFGEMRRLVGPSVTLLGNIPPRDILAQGTPDEVRACAGRLLEEAREERRVIFSCGGGMPPGTPSANIDAFIETIRNGLL